MGIHMYEHVCRGHEVSSPEYIVDLHVRCQFAVKRRFQCLKLVMKVTSTVADIAPFDPGICSPKLIWYDLNHVEQTSSVTSFD